MLNSRITYREVPLRMKELLCLEGLLEGCLLLGDRRSGRVHCWRRRTHLGAGKPAAQLDFIRRGALAAVDSERKCSYSVKLKREGHLCELLITLICMHVLFRTTPISLARSIQKPPGA